MKQNKPYVIGLTGTIGAGKSTCSEIFMQNGIKVIDADKIAASVLEKDGEGLEAVKEAFGEDYVLEDGTYNRELMKDTILKDPMMHEKLNATLHPIIEDKVRKAFDFLKDEDVIVYDCPLLFEAGQESLVDEIFLVTADEETRLERLKKRDDISEQRAKDLSDLQLGEDEKLDRADTVLYNDSDRDDLKEAIEAYLRFLKNRLKSQSENFTSGT